MFKDELDGEVNCVVCDKTMSALMLDLLSRKEAEEIKDDQNKIEEVMKKS